LTSPREILGKDYDFPEWFDCNGCLKKAEEIIKNRLP
jgi:hypothetical protein